MIKHQVALSLLLAAALAFGLAACGGSGDSGAGTGSGTSNSQTDTGATLHPQRGGNATVLVDAGTTSWPTGLDPATNTTGAANNAMNEAIYGGLFLLRSDKDGSNARIAPYQASKGTLSQDAKTLTITLRKGITFSDGTPLNAKAVIWNFTRDTGSACTCAPSWKLRKKDPFTSPDPLTVVVHMAQPNAAALHSFPISSTNWIASPTAFKKMGEATFKLKPVGAGPFTVASDRLSSKLVLRRNPTFFKKGQPYLDTLTFTTVGGDQPAYQALLAGNGDIFTGMSTPPVIKQAAASSKLQVTQEPGTSPYMVHFNTAVPPFDNIKAREAIYYATNWQAIDKGLFDGKPIVVQGFTTPADLYYHQKTPGYRTYNPDKAKELIKELGGLSFQLDTTAVYTAKEVMTALQSQWQQVGMKVTTKAYQLNGLIKRYNSGKWQADLATAGAWDPASGVGIGFRFRSSSPFTGVKDPHLDALLQQGISTANDAQRDKTYQEIAKYISDKAYGMFGFSFAPAQVVVKGVHGPGLTTIMPTLGIAPAVIWAEVWKEKS